MPKYAITTTVTFYGEVEALDETDAEEQGWNWESEDFMYDGVYDITVEEIE
jgi:hypothetical protein